jgi:hypothetical protein
MVVGQHARGQPKKAAEPAGEVVALDQPAGQAPFQVAVGVDQTGNQDRAAEVDLPQAPPAARDVTRRTDTDDAARLDRDGSVGDRRAGDRDDMIRPKAERVRASGGRRRRPR